MTDTPVDISDQGDGGSAEFSEVEDLPFDQVRELFLTLGKALRAYQLYDENNPVYKRFVTSLREAFEGLWGEIEGLNVSVEEDRFALAGEEVYRSDSRSDSLSFLFYKDGVRDVTFLPGIEAQELERFLSLLQRAKALKAAEGDDLLTILWEEDLEFFKYYYVDRLTEGVAVPEARPEEDRPDLAGVLQEEMETEESASAETGEAPTGETPPPKVGRDDFQPALYALDPREKEQLKQELEAEMSRELRADVLAALFDRLEEPENAERQSEILKIFRDLLPNFLSRGAVASAADVLEQLAATRARPGGLDQLRQQECDALMDDLSSKETIEELIGALRDGTIDVPVEVLDRLLKYLNSGALPILLLASEEAEEKGLKETLRRAVRGIADENREALIALLEDGNAVTARGAARLVGEMGLSDAAPKLVRLMSHPDGAVRLVSVEAARTLGASSAAPGLINALTDSDRDVRVGAARALAGMQYTTAASAFEAVVTGKEIRQADLTEKIAVFESYGIVGGAGAVEVLDKLLSKKGLLSRKEPPEIRASAARALGKIRMPKAQKALAKAQDDSDAVVRTAVRKALQGAEEPE